MIHFRKFVWWGPATALLWLAWGASAPQASRPPRKAMAFVQPANFPPAALPPDNVPGPAGIALGKALFFEPNLSRNGKLACSNCHQPDQAFSDPPKRVSVGMGTGRRNSMALFNLAWVRQGYFWDGRVPTLRQQVLHPLRDSLEMGMELDSIAPILKRTPGYAALFEAAFGDGEVNLQRVGLALEQYLLSLVSANSRYDRWKLGQIELTAQEKRGWELFFSKKMVDGQRTGAGCFRCHGPPLFGSSRFVQNGLEEVTDLGRYEVTGKEEDRHAFRVPGLRNLKFTAPYMHDGRFSNLEEVLEHYLDRLPTRTNLPEDLQPLAVETTFSCQDRKDLLAFLNTLNGEGAFPQVPAEAGGRATFDHLTE